MLKIDGVEFGAFISKYGDSEWLEKVQGPNAGQTIDGTIIEDVVKWRRCCSFICNPLTTSQLHDIVEALKHDYVSIERFWGLENGALKLLMVPEIGTVKVALRKHSGDYYDALMVTLKER